MFFKKISNKKKENFTMYDFMNSMNSLVLQKNGRSRAINEENPKGEKSMGGVAGGGHKGSPCVEWVKPGQVVTLLDVEGCGTVRHIWLTFPPYHPDLYRGLVIRMYWDDQEQPSVEAPVGDFFGIAHMRYRQIIKQM